MECSSEKNNQPAALKRTALFTLSSRLLLCTCDLEAKNKRTNQVGAKRLLGLSVAAKGFVGQVHERGARHRKPKVSSLFLGGLRGLV